ncbi:unnamed protein product [Didymodactylos carnosus]|uniref:Transient receptor potential cation channel subfamily A member 1 n=1 Tax=Didymodactylos carnosus TaxID=1234261 RepID=A0A814PUM8_9BILA|nr:unnamed protein product [Didymodactylos carnosus]CAF1111170.1 unnamed protein product [Didymodactylos carnosus]CAF3695158.1 unnamed protein product [Didymodactylos carnosus]CAF3875573.1 unnamed protein product [Didymodactylos carnosus]
MFENAVSKLNATPLHFACFSSRGDDECLKMIKLLFDGAKRKDYIVDDGPTPSRTFYVVIPVDLQKQAEHEQIRQDKKQRNLDQYVNMRNSDEQTALTIVTNRGFAECVKELIKLTNESNLSMESAIKSNNIAILDKYLEKYENSQQALGGSGIHRLVNVNQKSCLYLLHLACKYNNDDILAHICKKDELKEKPEQLSVKDDNGYTPVLVAAKYGNNKCIKYLIENHKPDLKIMKEKIKNEKKNILHLCAENCKIPPPSPPPPPPTRQNGHIEICKLIIKEYKSLLEDVDYDGNSPLHIACKYGHKDLSEMFLTAIIEDNKSKLQGYLLKKNSKSSTSAMGGTALHEATMNGHIDILKLMFKKMDGIEIKEFLDYQCKNNDGQTLLHMACAKGHIEIVKYLIEEWDVNVNSFADKRVTPIYLACENGYLAVVKYLLDYTDADATIRNAKGYNCLDISIENRHELVVEKLLLSDYEDWEKLMKSAQFDERNVPLTPMRRLIIYMPDIALRLIDNKFTKRIGGNNGQTMYSLKYDYKYFEDQYLILDWIHGYRHIEGEEWWKPLDRTIQLWSKGIKADSSIRDPVIQKKLINPKTYTNDSYTLVRNHPLLLLSQCEQTKLMSHDYCIQLRKEKFRRFNVYVFGIVFLVFLLFVALYTTIVLTSTHPQNFYNLYNQSDPTINLQWDYGFSIQLCEKVGNYLLQTQNEKAKKDDRYLKIKFALYVFLIIFITKNVFLILAAFPRLFRKLAYYLESLALVLCFVFLLDWYDWQSQLSFRCPIQWELVSCR